MKEPMLTEQIKTDEEHDHHITEGKNIPTERNRICENIRE
jgi:hypothetical protein